MKIFTLKIKYAELVNLKNQLDQDTALCATFVLLNTTITVYGFKVVLVKEIINILWDFC